MNGLVCKEKPQFISQKVPKISYELVSFWWFWWNHKWNVQRDVKNFILTVKLFLTATASSCWKLLESNGAELKTLIKQIHPSEVLLLIIKIGPKWEKEPWLFLNIWIKNMMSWKIATEFWKKDSVTARGQRPLARTTKHSVLNVSSVIIQVKNWGRLQLLHRD